jgi:hypothetical protein
MKWILERYNGLVWTGLVWLRIATSFLLYPQCHEVSLVAMAAALSSERCRHSEVTTTMVTKIRVFWVIKSVKVKLR